jgi:hypothetical protein
LKIADCNLQEIFLVRIYFTDFTQSQYSLDNVPIAAIQKLLGHKKGQQPKYFYTAPKTLNDKQWKFMKMPAKIHTQKQRGYKRKFVTP